jgi:cytochrome c-type biogenesis protein CcmF
MYYAGLFVVLLVAVLALVSIICNLLAIRRKNSRFFEVGNLSAAGTFIAATAASLLLFYLLARADFSVQYVAEYVNKDMILPYRLAAFWDGNRGSTLLWGWILTAYAFLIVIMKRKSRFLPVVNIVIMTNVLFFFLLIALKTNPFLSAQTVIQNGKGLNPMLFNIDMIVHPIATYIGYIGWIIPCGFAIAALINSDTSDDWLEEIRVWAIVVWLFLTVGVLWGAWWSYRELGWGGYWSWDPVENSSLIPWLIGTTFVHSMIAERRFQIFKQWNKAIAIITYILIILGTYTVRGGILQSVHAYSHSKVGNILLGFIVFLIISTLVLFLVRRSSFQQGSAIDVLSPEGSFLLSNYVFGLFAFAIFIGTYWPIISHFLAQYSTSLDKVYFNNISSIFGILILLLMAWCFTGNLKHTIKSRLFFLAQILIVAVLAAAVITIKGIFPGYAAFVLTLVFLSLLVFGVSFWVKYRYYACNENSGPKKSFLRVIQRNRRRYGEYLIHIGIVVIIVGIIGSHTMQQKAIVTLKSGEHMKLGGYTITYEGLTSKKNNLTNGKAITVYANLLLKEESKDISYLRPSVAFYKNQPPLAVVGLLSTPHEDVYTVLAGWGNNGQTVTIEGILNPFQVWIWYGGIILILGTVISLIPGKKPNSAQSL